MWYKYLILALLTVMPAICYLIAHLIFRLATGWRRYRGVGLAEVGFVMVCSFPVVVGDSNFALVVPISLAVSVDWMTGQSPWTVATFSGPDLGMGFAFYGLWLFTILAITAFRVAWNRRKRRVAAAVREME